MEPLFVAFGKALDGRRLSSGQGAVPNVFVYRVTHRKLVPVADR